MLNLLVPSNPNINLHFTFPIKSMNPSWEDKFLPFYTKVDCFKLVIKAPNLQQSGFQATHICSQRGVFFVQCISNPETSFMKRNRFCVAWSGISRRFPSNPSHPTPPTANQWFELNIPRLYNNCSLRNKKTDIHRHSRKPPQPPIEVPVFSVFHWNEILVGFEEPFP